MMMVMMMVVMMMMMMMMMVMVMMMMFMTVKVIAYLLHPHPGEPVLDHVLSFAEIIVLHTYHTLFQPRYCPFAGLLCDFRGLLERLSCVSETQVKINR
jgi:hypothetical protein